MFKLLAFLLILCVLFGVETTRELFFGTVGFIFWAIIIVVGIGLLALGLRDDRTPEEKKKDEELEPRDTTPKPLPKLPIRAWLIIAVQAAVLIAIIWFVAHTLKI